MIEFEKYIEAREVTDDPIGDIVGPLKGDPWTASINTGDELFLYLIHHPKTSKRYGMGAAVEETWDDFEQSEFFPKNND